MTNSEIRRVAWERLFKGQWFWKLFGAGVLLWVYAQAVQTVLGRILARLGAVGWIEYARIVAENQKTLTTPVPELTQNFIWTASTVTGLELFVGWIMAGIASYGAAVVLVRCLKDDAEGWLGAAFGGFKMPLGLFALMFRYVLIWLGWTILSIPTLGLLLLVPFYRYRYLWLVKAEHPELGAGACLKATRQLMDGNKMRSFRLDCSYWKPITLVLVFWLLAMVFVGLFGRKIGADAFIGSIVLLLLLVILPAVVVLGQYINVGQGLLYRELTETKG